MLFGLNASFLYTEFLYIQRYVSGYVAFHWCIYLCKSTTLFWVTQLLNMLESNTPSNTTITTIFVYSQTLLWNQIVKFLIPRQKKRRTLGISLKFLWIYIIISEKLKLLFYCLPTQENGECLHFLRFSFMQFILNIVAYDSDSEYLHTLRRNFQDR